MKNKFKDKLHEPWFAYTFAAAVAVLLYIICTNLPEVWNAVGNCLKALSPIFTSIAVAYLFNPIVVFFEKKVFKKMKKESAKHVISVVLTMICFVLLLALLMTALIPSIAKSISNLTANWQSYKEKATELLATVKAFAEEKNIKFDFDQIQKFFDNITDKAFDLLKNNSKAIMSSLGNVGSSVSNFGVGVLFGFAFLFMKNQILIIIHDIRAAVRKENKIQKTDEFLKHCNDIFLSYYGCTLLDSLIIGIATVIFMLIMKMPYAPLIAVICAFTNIIPTIGPMIGSIIAIFFLVLDNPMNALLFFIFSCILQALDGMLIKPILFKDSLGLPGAFTLILLIIGGKIAGMLGIILSIPVGAILVILYRERISPRLNERRLKINEKTDTTEEDKVESTETE